MFSKQKTIALALWWCEGTKIRRDKRWKNAYLYPIEITNTDPKIIKIFLDYLKIELKVPNHKLRGQIQIHDGDDKSKIEHFWSNYLNIPMSQFNKTIIRARGSRFKNQYGTFKLRTYNKNTFQKLQFLLEKELEIFDK
ncbi:MAG: hypothetical protein AAB508_03075 [Patescibacteria group bacterium]